jgi:hypothetical protein
MHGYRHSLREPDGVPPLLAEAVVVLDSQQEA